MLNIFVQRGLLVYDMLRILCELPCSVSLSASCRGLIVVRGMMPYPRVLALYTRNYTSMPTGTAVLVWYALAAESLLFGYVAV